MKKLTFILVSFIVASIMLAGCANDDYAIEKRYWQAQKQAEKIFRNPAASPPNELERVVKILSGFSQKYPKSNLAVDAEFNIARLYIVKEEYEKARTQLRTMMNRYAISNPICSEALFLIGNSYQIQNNWDLALVQYKMIMQEFPLTLRGLDIPVYIANYYKVKYQPDKMIAAFQEAIDHYKALARKHSNSPLALNATNLVAQCYIALKDWQNAVDTFEGMITTYKGKVNMDNILLDIALIYNKELKDNTRAKQALERLTKDYPRSRLIKPATALLKNLEKK